MSLSAFACNIYSSSSGTSKGLGLNLTTELLDSLSFGFINSLLSHISALFEIWNGYIDATQTLEFPTGYVTYAFAFFGTHRLALHNHNSCRAVVYCYRLPIVCKVQAYIGNSSTNSRFCCNKCQHSTKEVRIALIAWWESMKNTPDKCRRISRLIKHKLKLFHMLESLVFAVGSKSWLLHLSCHLRGSLRFVFRRSMRSLSVLTWIAFSEFDVERLAIGLNSSSCCPSSYYPSIPL